MYFNIMEKKIGITDVNYKPFYRLAMYLNKNILILFSIQVWYLISHFNYFFEVSAFEIIFLKFLPILYFTWCIYREVLELTSHQLNLN